MKKLLFVLLFFSIPTVTFSQVHPLSEKQILIDVEDHVTIKPFENKGFILVQKAFNEKSKKENIWRFSLYDLELSVAWAKETILDKYYNYSKMDFYAGSAYILFTYDNGNGYNSTTKFTIVTINPEGALSSKEFELKKTPLRTSLILIDDAYYFNATTTKGFKGFENLCKIDLSTMTFSQKPIDVPEKCSVTRSFSVGNSIYYRVSKMALVIGGDDRKKPEYDFLYRVVDNEIVDKIPIKIGSETLFDNLNLVSTDSAHSYFLGISKKWLKGDRFNDENYDYNLFLNKLSGNELEPFRNLDKKYLYELASKTEIAVKNGGFGSEKKLSDNNYIISSNFRYKNKNFVVFDKYQSKVELLNRNRYRITYLFTNSLIWCFDDEGEIEWTKNIEYNIISDNLEPKTKAFAYKNNTIGFIGQFDDEVKLVTLSMDGDVIEGTDKYNTLKVLDMDEDLVYKNSITPLFGNKYLVWSKVNETFDEEKLKKKKKIYTIGLNLKIVEIQ